MPCQYVDAELAHLERILPHIASGPLPPDYWRKRLDKLETTALMPQQRARIAHLHHTLDLLDAALRRARAASSALHDLDVPPTHVPRATSARHDTRKALS